MKVNENGKAWKDFLTFSSRFFNFSFLENLALYENYPNYTALATYDTWNALNRRIIYGSKAVIIGDNKYFDISQTQGEDIKIWEFNEGYINNYIMLLNRIGLCDVSVTQNKKMELVLPDYVHTAINRNDSLTGALKFGGVDELISDTVAYMTYKRLGMDEQAEQINFDYINRVNDKMLISIGKSAFDYAKKYIRNAEQVVLYTTPQVYEEENNIINDFENADEITQMQSVAIEQQTDSAEIVDDNYISEDIDNGFSIIEDENEQESVSHDTDDTDVELVSEEQCIVDDRSDTLANSIYDVRTHTQRVVVYERDTTIKNLNQLKNFVKVGMEFEIISHTRPSCVGERRVITSKNTVGFTSQKFDENGVPTGKDIHFEWGKAKDWEIKNGEFVNKFENSDDVIMGFRFVEKSTNIQIVEQNTKQEIIEDERPNKHVVNFDNQLIYDNFEKLFPDIVSGKYRYLRCEKDGYEPLVIEDISIGYTGAEYSIAHYYEQNGDMMRDPEITFVIDRDTKTITSTSYTQDGLGLYQDFTQGSKGREDCDDFFRQWLTNIDNQHYKYVRGIESKTDIEIAFENGIEKVNDDTRSAEMGTITLYKLGDFYEMYNEDAQIGAELLDRRILKKGGTNGMVAFSVYEYDECVQKLRDNGYETIVSETRYIGATAEQIELPADLPEKYNEQYNRLYDALNNVEGYDKAVEIGDRYINDNAELVGNFVKLRGDYLSSDREIAAFAFALVDVGLIDNFVEQKNEQKEDISNDDVIRNNISAFVSDFGISADDFLKIYNSYGNTEFPTNKYDALALNELVNNADAEILKNYFKVSRDVQAKAILHDVLYNYIIERKGEQIPNFVEPAVSLMSDSTEITDKYIRNEDEGDEYTMTFKSENHSALVNIKDTALTLGATCTTDEAAHKLIVQIWSEHYDDLLLTAFENDVDDIETVNSRNNLILEGYSPTTRYAIIHNDNSEYEIIDGIYNGRKATHNAYNYPYNVQIWNSNDDGFTFVYSGEGKFCKTLDEAKAFIEKDRNVHQKLDELDLKVGDDVYLESTRYVVEKLEQQSDSIELLDTRGVIPITRVEHLSDVLDMIEKDEKQQALVETIKLEKPANFHIEDDNLSMEGGAKTKYKQNIAALKTLKQIEQENRNATHDEMVTLSQYVGWGGIPEAFDNTNSAWSDEYAELKELLTEDEYANALATVNNAHYTQPIIIKAMYKAVKQFGLEGGNILEPSAAIGNFLGCMPVDMESQSKLTAVEIDDVSGRICRQLYPRADVQITGFEDAKLKDNSFDLAIGNVPFGNYTIVDRKYNRNKALIHDYFVLKSLDMVRPNGIVAVITSSGTLDKRSSKIREAISEKAELIGAIRLPNTAFKSNALTETVTDILFLQKRAVPTTVERNWLDVVEFEDENARFHWERKTGVYFNKYFADNPDMICGNFKLVSGKYGKELTVEPYEDKTLEQALDECISKLASNIVVAYEPTVTIVDDKIIEVEQGEVLPAIEGMRINDMRVVNGKIFKRTGNVMVEDVNLSHDTKNLPLFIDAIELANKARECLSLQSTDISDEQYEVSRKELNDKYLSFVQKHKNIKDSKTNRLINSLDFNDAGLLQALEKEENGKIYPSDILTKRTIHYRHKVTHCDTAADAFQVSLAQKGRIDMELIAELTDKSIEDCVSELNGILMYRDPQAYNDNKDISEGWIPQDEYLSGNIREKLRIASAYVMAHKELEINVQALEKSMPERIKASDIACQLGSSWIPTKYIEEFIIETFDMYSAKVEHNPRTSNWYVDNKSDGNWREITSVEYGTKDKNALEILEDILNLRESKVYKEITDQDGNPKRVVDAKKTEQANNKAEKIKDKFRVWIYQDAERTRDLENIYNERFNSERPRVFDGSHLTFEGMTDDVELLPHQKNAIARVLYGGSTLLAHCVGAGKTYEMAASAMEMRRIGLATKPLFVVPNHLVGQWGQEFYTLYPNAHILLATNKDFEQKRRKEFVARIATSDIDAVIMAYSTFEKIEVTPEKRKQYYRDEIRELEEIIESERNHGKSLSVRNAQTMIKRLQANLESLEFETSRDTEIYFEQLGVDALFVDEAHNFKNLSINTKLSRVSGINSAKAKRASDMLLKIRCIKEKNDGDDRNVVFATGTPISNSITEMYVMQQYLQPNYLESKGLQAFDSWLADFAEISTQIELAPTGNSWRSKTRCNQFKNVPELMMMFKHCTDVQTAKMLNLPIPKLKNGQPTICIIQPSEIQKQYIKMCGERADAIHARAVDPKDDNMLKVTNDGKMCALDFRLIDNGAPDEPNSKVNCCINNVFKKWEETKEDKLAQVIFLDKSTPCDGFNLYDDIKQKLIAKGVPEKEIAFIHNAKNDAQKLSMFTKVNKGDIRIILGSTEKLGAGTNMQNKLCALHHLDVPWRPADIEQREGRILRRGNTCDEVEIFRYATEGTFDSYSWQTIENKQKMISQVMTDKPMGRSIDDVDEQALSYAEIKSLATGDERIKEQLELSMEVTKLKSLRGQFLSEQIAARDKITFEFPQRIERTKELIKNFEQDVDFIKHSVKPDKFNVKLLGGTFTDREEAGSCIRKLRDAHSRSEFELGNYRGFDLKLKYFCHDLTEGSWQIEIHRTATRYSTFGVSLADVFDNIDKSIDYDFEEGLKYCQDNLDNLKKDLEYSKQLAAKTFDRQDELDEKTARLEQLTSELKLNDRSDNSGVTLEDENVRKGNSKKTDNSNDDEDLDLTDNNRKR